ncbi:MAG: PfkB family carbohydrate kinase [Cellulomonadaceae bacterium]
MVAIDTVGAGDTFCGVLGTELSHGAGLAAAARTANAAAAIAVTRRGGSTAAPRCDEVLALLATATKAPPR